MEKAAYSKIKTCKNVYENYIEDKIFQDLIIPDYKCSARKIISCEAETTIFDKHIRDGKAVLEGVCSWKILYLSDEDELMHHLNCDKQFSEHFTVPDEECGIRFKVKTSNVICKLLGPQKAECKATLCVALQLIGSNEKQILAVPESGDVELRSVQSEMFEPCYEGEKEFKITGEIAIKCGDEMDVYSTKADILAKEIKCFDDKIVVKGNLKNHVILLSQTTCKAESIENDIPFTQVFQIDGIKESNTASVRFRTTEIETSYIGEKSDGSLLICNNICADISVFDSKTVCFHQDAYHPIFDIDIKTDEIEFCQSIELMEISGRISQNVHIDTRDIDVIYSDVVGEVEKISAHDNILIVDGKVEVGLICKTGEDIAKHIFSLPIQATRTLQNIFDSLKCEAGLVVENFGFLILSDSEIEITCDYRIPLSVMVLGRQTVITDLSLTDQKHEQFLDTPLVIYYGTSGEELWDIGKKYSVPIESIKQNNGLHEECLTDDQIVFISKR